MAASWRARAGGDRHGVPVEMRFIDLFMAALGALIFMAMLLAFLARFFDHGLGFVQEAAETPVSDGPLAIATRSLPPARVGEPYELAFAYRGGAGPVAWRIAAGGKEIPQGLSFDAEQGRLAGTPAERATARFVLQARDAERGEAQRPFELVVEAGGAGSRRLETWAGGFLIALLALIWFATLAAVAQTKQRLAHLRMDHGQGKPFTIFRDGEGNEDHVVRLPGGIAEYQTRLTGTRWVGRFLLLLLVVMTAWFIWRVWLT